VLHPEGGCGIFLGGLFSVELLDSSAALVGQRILGSIETPDVFIVDVAVVSEEVIGSMAIVVVVAGSLVTVLVGRRIKLAPRRNHNGLLLDSLGEMDDGATSAMIVGSRLNLRMVLMNSCFVERGTAAVALAAMSAVTATG
jgi:hypothetical protein